MSENVSTMPLPPGVTVRMDILGANYKAGDSRLFVHPYDNDVARKTVWMFWWNHIITTFNDMRREDIEDGRFMEFLIDYMNL